MLLEIRNLSVSYGKALALEDVSLAVGEGEFVAVLGPNGAGKSTIFLTASGLLKATGGSIRFRNQELAGMKPSEVVKRGVVLCPEGRKLFPQMSVLKNLMLGAYLRRDAGAVAADLERVYGLFPILKERAPQVVGTLSGGQQQMVAIGRALMGKPALLLLDEPSVGIAHRLKIEIFDAIKRIQKSGTAILMAEQDAQSALRIADRVYVLEHGRVGREGSSAELGADDYIRQAYLGVG